MRNVPPEIQTMSPVRPTFRLSIVPLNVRPQQRHDRKTPDVRASKNSHAKPEAAATKSDRGAHGDPAARSQRGQHPFPSVADTGSFSRLIQGGQP